MLPEVTFTRVIVTDNPSLHNNPKFLNKPGSKEYINAYLFVPDIECFIYTTKPRSIWPRKRSKPGDGKPQLFKIAHEKQSKELKVYNPSWYRRPKTNTASYFVKVLLYIFLI